MKTIVQVLSAMLLLINAAIAQPTRGENPKYDPAYNPYEKILEDTARGKRTARFLKNFLVPEVMTDKFMSSPCNDYAVLGDTRIEQFNDFVAKFLSMPSDPKQMKIAEDNYKKQGCAKTIGDLNYKIEYLEKQGTYTGDDTQPIENLLCRAKGSIQYVKNQLTYLEALKKIFPSTPDADNAIQVCKDAIAKYGTNKAILAAIKANQNAALADVYMPKAVSQNAEWEAEFKNWFLKEYPGYSVIRQSLLSSNWYEKKNEISNLPEYRQIGTAIGAKAPDGKCWIIKVDLYQDYMGGKYNAGRYKTSEQKEMLCENLK
jgi:hypothetical protein